MGNSETVLMTLGSWKTEKRGNEGKNIRREKGMEAEPSAVTKQAAGVWLDSLNSLWVDWIFGWKGMSSWALAFIVSSRCYNGQPGSFFFFFFLRGWRGNQTFVIASFVAKHFFAIVSSTAIQNLI